MRCLLFHITNIIALLQALITPLIFCNQHCTPTLFHLNPVNLPLQTKLKALVNNTLIVSVPSLLHPQWIEVFCHKQPRLPFCLLPRTVSVRSQSTPEEDDVLFTAPYERSCLISNLLVKHRDDTPQGRMSSHHRGYHCLYFLH